MLLRDRKTFLVGRKAQQNRWTRLQGVKLTASSRNMIVTAAAKEMDAPASVASVRSLQGSPTSHCIMYDQPSMVIPSMAWLCYEAGCTPWSSSKQHIAL